MDNFSNTTHPSNSTYCAQTAPFWSSVQNGQTYNLTVPGNPPYKVHNRLQDRSLGYSLCFWQNLPGNLTTNTFSWTPVVQPGAGARPMTEGNETDFRAFVEAGDAVIWVFTETAELDNANGVSENRVFISGNFTVRTQDMIDNGELDEGGAESGSWTRKQLSSKFVFIAGMLALASLRC